MKKKIFLDDIYSSEGQFVKEVHEFYLTGGQKAVKVFKKIIEARMSLGLDEEKSRNAEKFRKEVFNYYLKK